MKQEQFVTLTGIFNQFFVTLYSLSHFHSLSHCHSVTFLLWEKKNEERQCLLRERARAWGCQCFPDKHWEKAKSVPVLSVFAANTEKKVVVECFLGRQTLSKGEDRCWVFSRQTLRGEGCCRVFSACKHWVGWRPVLRVSGKHWEKTGEDCWVFPTLRGRATTVAEIWDDKDTREDVKTTQGTGGHNMAKTRSRCSKEEARAKDEDTRRVARRSVRKVHAANEARKTKRPRPVWNYATRKNDGIWCSKVFWKEKNLLKSGSKWLKKWISSGSEVDLKWIPKWISSGYENELQNAKSGSQVDFLGKSTWAPERQKWIWSGFLRKIHLSSRTNPGSRLRVTLSHPQIIK